MREFLTRLRASTPVGFGFATAMLTLKELREHWAVLLLISSLLGLTALILIFARVVSGEMGGALELLHGLISFFGVPVALVLGNRLVVSEYRSRTQLFLETLPLRRLHMLAVKYALGLGTLLGLLALGLLLSVVLGMDSDPVGLLHLFIAAARGAVFLWFAWSCCFVLGLLGRYRILVFLTAVVVMVVVDTTSTLELSRIAPMELIDSDYAFEREVVPWADLGWTSLSSLVLSLLAMGLGLVREGSIAARLSQKMSQREKLSLAGLFVVALFAVYVADERVEPLPFDLVGAHQVKHGPVRVQVLPPDPELASFLAVELGELWEWLGYTDDLNLFVAARRDLEPSRFVRGHLEEHGGVLIRASAQADRRELLRFTIEQALLHATSYRSDHEDRGWLAAGMAPWWETRDRAELPLIADPTWARRVAWALPHGAPDPDPWFTLWMEQGDEMAEAIGWSALRTLSHTAGPEATQAFARAMLRPHDDPNLGEVLDTWRCDTWCHLEGTAGVGREELLHSWSQGLRSARAAHAVEVSAVPRLAATLRAEPLGGVDRAVFVDMTAQPWPEGARVEVRHAVLEELKVWTETPERERRTIAAEIPLHGQFQQGQRLGLEVVLDDPVLGCEVVAGWRTWEVP